MKQDRHDRLRFAALQSEAGHQLLEQFHLSTTAFDSFVFITNNKYYKSSTAVLMLAKKLPWYWQWFQLFWIVPTFIRNAIYNWIARNRYKWFGKQDSCMIPTAAMRRKFL